ncbi:MAG: hypothetical protein RIS09_8 [Actinomycetota bacterium]|jgi:KDO2-lipid IV(A) lauroyltransferase
MLFKVAWTIPRFTPELIQRFIYGSIATLGFVLRPPGVKRLQFNMSRVIGAKYWSLQALTLTWKAMHSYFKYWRQMFAMNHRDANFVFTQSNTYNKELIESHLATGEGCFIVATHSGNWDVAGAWLGLTFGNILTVAEKLEPEVLFKMFVQARERFNLSILAHSAGDSTIDILSEALGQNKIVAIVADRTLSSRGIDVKMFGYQCKLPAGPYAIAKRAGVAVIPGAIWFEGEKTLMEVFEPISVANKSAEEFSQELAEAFENIIAQHPENWHMFQQVWPDHPKKWGGR